VETTTLLPEQQTGLVMLGNEYAGIIPIVNKLVRLSPRDIRIVESIVQMMHAENAEN